MSGGGGVCEGMSGGGGVGDGECEGMSGGGGVGDGECEGMSGGGGVGGGVCEGMSGRSRIAPFHMNCTSTFQVSLSDGIYTDGMVQGQLHSSYFHSLQLKAFENRLTRTAVLRRRWLLVIGLQEGSSSFNRQ